MLNIFVNGFTLTFLVVWFFVIGLTLVCFLIMEIIITKMETDKYIDEKNEEELKEKFYKKLDIVKTQQTDEILESLIEMNELDEIYNQIVDNEYTFMDELSYYKMKEDVLTVIINEKIDKVKSGKKKKENMKSLKSELEICKDRYPVYNAVFVDSINKIK